MKTSLFAVVLLLCPTLASAQQTPQTPPTFGDHSIGVSSTDVDGLATGYRASKLIGAPLFNDEGQRLGKVADVVLKADGTVAGVVVDVGTFLGLGKRQIAIPLRHLERIQNKLTVHGATKDALKKVPEFKYGTETVAPA
ncbi:MAG: PRC-barrel domain protein [Myxococcaceae bacterium]|nr:PRC-barrel domain protein [Myxococcaceae bacterium]